MKTKHKKIVTSIFLTSALRAIFSGILAIALLSFVFITKRDQTVLGIITYPIILYGLVILMINTPKISRAVRDMIAKNKFGKRYLTDITLRAKLSLYQGTVINLCFVIVYIYTSIQTKSTWFLAIAIYYITLSLIRLYLLEKNRKATSLLSQLKTYQFCGYFMFIINLGMAGMIIQMIWQNKSFSYPELTIYAVAIYTFFAMILAICSIFSIKKIHNPILTAAKQVRFSVAVMSMFTLQTVMITHFGTESNRDRLSMNLISGCVALIVVFATAVFMVVDGTRKLKQKKQK